MKKAKLPLDWIETWLHTNFLIVCFHSSYSDSAAAIFCVYCTIFLKIEYADENDRSFAKIVASISFLTDQAPFIKSKNTPQY